MTILLASAAALLLVPAAQAFAGTATVQIAGTGAGEVNSSPDYVEFAPGELEGTPPIACTCSPPGPATGVCTDEPEYKAGPNQVQIALRAVPAAGSEFTGWTVEEGIDAYAEVCAQWASFMSAEEWTAYNGGVPCFLTAEGASGHIKATATFTCTLPGGCSAAPSGPKLTLNIEEGSGTVVSNPAGIECTGTSPHECSTESIAENTEVLLTASPASGYLFKSWKGCDTGKVN